MHKMLLTSIVVIGSTAAVVVGQAQTPATKAPRPPTAATVTAMDGSRATTYTGCLQRDMAATGTTPSAGGTSSASGTSTPLSFVLANATPTTVTSRRATDQRSKPVGTSGTNASAVPSASYRLEGDGAKLTPHVGHKIEVTGTLDERLSAPGNLDTTSGNIARTSGNPAIIKVANVKMLSSSCVAD